jgi:hypothetical protein
MWDEYDAAPYTLWQTTEHEGKDTTRCAFLLDVLFVWPAP